MKPADTPSDETLRDLLYRKVKNSNLMSYGIHMYNSLNEGDPKKSYQTLRDMIRRHTERQTEDKMLLEKEKAVKNVPTYFRASNPAVRRPKQRPHLRPMVQRNRNPNHREQWGKLKKQLLSSLHPTQRDIQKTRKGKERVTARTEEEPV